MRILVFRTLLIYLSVLFAMRLMGKRQLGELQPAELVSTILISNLASISIESADVPITASLVPLFLITAIEILDSIFSLKFPTYAHLVSGRPKAVIRNGKIDQKVLGELRLSISDLLEALRGKDIFDVRDVAYAIVETNGSINAAKVSVRENVTREDLALSAPSEKATVPFILDGQILPENLSYCGKDSRWLKSQALKMGFSVEDILLSLGNGTNEILWVKKESCPQKASSSSEPQ